MQPSIFQTTSIQSATPTPDRASRITWSRANWEGKSRGDDDSGDDSAGDVGEEGEMEDGDGDGDEDEDEDEDEEEEEEEEEEEDEDEDGEVGEEDDEELDDEDGQEEDHLTPLLPIFEAAHLDALPVYNLTHALRLLVVLRCETTLSWEQLRSPQVSQFLIKPIQQQILESHFSRGTIYALMANCLQFTKEITLNPGNSGTSKTRALVCELLAIKLLKEFTTRELIDALSYDFFPMQGLPSSDSAKATSTPLGSNAKARPLVKAARVSALEIAIRTQAKRFLAHPLVVQQLEAIWAGTIVFHFAADSLHRLPAKLASKVSRYGTLDRTKSADLEYGDSDQISKPRKRSDSLSYTARRTATLYNPKEASLFKLSRLRVPRYRHKLSTFSLAILLVLFILVLKQRSLSITALEIVFWFWSSGFMLDEVVGFNEQGFSLYIMSFWNTFDLGILGIFVCYYCLRLYGILMPDTGKRTIADAAYDVLATNAVLLFPRLFSVLDHYRYFSQLLIAFRMMAMDLVAVFILILISCSGFFVAFTLSFGNDDFNGSHVAYALFQMLMGFTPAAWDQWPKYNILGKSILVLFLFICHFLIVTILITVLTNSFMAIVQNANDEHQFVFAVNTISMVKSDALFSYVAPTNVIAWLLAPWRYLLPFRTFVKLNRTVIKITHFPILWIIYAYERMMLQNSSSEATELMEQRGRKDPSIKPLDTTGGTLNLFRPRHPRLRERSIATYNKDRVLEEVFRHPYQDLSRRASQKTSRRLKTSHAVNTWIQGMGGISSSHEESIMPTLPKRSGSGPRRRNFTTTTRSAASDPGDFTASQNLTCRASSRQGRAVVMMMVDDAAGDGNGDDKLITTGAATPDHTTLENARTGSEKGHRGDYFTTGPAHQPRRCTVPLESTKAPTGLEVASISEASPLQQGRVQQDRSRQSPFQEGQYQTILETPTECNEALETPRKRNLHDRTPSSTTMIFNPANMTSLSAVSIPQRLAAAKSSDRSIDPISGASGIVAPSSPHGRKSTKRPPLPTSRSRPILPTSSAFPSANDLSFLSLRALENLPGSPSHRPSMGFGMDIASDLGDNKAVAGGFVGAVPASFATQIALATAASRAARDLPSAAEDQARMSKLMLARMRTLEDSFGEVLRELRDWRQSAGGGVGIGDQERGTKHRGRARSGGIGARRRPKDDAEATKRRSAEWIDEPEEVQDLNGAGGEDAAKGSSI